MASEKAKAGLEVNVGSRGRTRQASVPRNAPLSQRDTSRSKGQKQGAEPAPSTKKAAQSKKDEIGRIVEEVPLDQIKEEDVVPSEVVSIKLPKKHQ